VIHLKHRREPDYAKRARRRFCGTSRKTPAELVLSGKRSLEEWVEVLNQERLRGKRLPRQPRFEPQHEFESQGGTHEN
jgi:hypothetical protein